MSEVQMALVPFITLSDHEIFKVIMDRESNNLTKRLEYHFLYIYNNKVFKESYLNLNLNLKD